jgi:hypothetical protein
MCIVHFTSGGLLVGYNENESTNNVKVMSVYMLFWAMDHPPPTKMYMTWSL